MSSNGFPWLLQVADPDWKIRSVAMQMYYAQRAWVATNESKGLYTADLSTLQRFAPLGPAALNGSCTGLPHVSLAAGGTAYTAHVASADPTWPPPIHQRTASVTQDRYLLVK